MINWLPFNGGGINYDLTHLWPEVWVYTHVGVNGKPDLVYRIRIIYSLHTFTKGLEPNHDVAFNYADARESRTFCPDRYNKSLQLPKIMKNLDRGHIFHTNSQNFMRIDNGAGLSYEVFFTVQRSSEVDNDLNIYVQSSYDRTRGNSPKAGKIKFSVIAYNTLHNKPIKVYRR